MTDTKAEPCRLPAVCPVSSTRMSISSLRIDQRRRLFGIEAVHFAPLTGIRQRLRKIACAVLDQERPPGVLHWALHFRIPAHPYGTLAVLARSECIRCLLPDLPAAVRSDMADLSELVRRVPLRPSQVLRAWLAARPQHSADGPPMGAR